MLPHLTGVPHLHVDRPLKRPLALVFLFPAIRHFTNEKGSNWSRMGVFLRELLGMRWSAIGLTNLFPIYSPVPSNSPRSPCESKLGPVSSFLKVNCFFSSVHTFFFLVFEQHVSRDQFETSCKTGSTLGYCVSLFRCLANVRSPDCWVRERQQQRFIPLMGQTCLATNQIVAVCETLLQKLVSSSTALCNLQKLDLIREW